MSHAGEKGVFLWSFFVLFLFLSKFVEFMKTRGRIQDDTRCEMIQGKRGKLLFFCLVFFFFFLWGLVLVFGILGHLFVFFEKIDKILF